MRRSETGFTDEQRTLPLGGSDPTQPLTGGSGARLILDRYRMERRLGAGGFAVWASRTGPDSRRPGPNRTEVNATAKIIVTVPDISNPFFSQILQGIEDAAQRFRTGAEDLDDLSAAHEEVLHLLLARLQALRRLRNAVQRAADVLMGGDPGSREPCACEVRHGLQPHGVDVDPSGEYIVGGGKLATVIPVHSFTKMTKAIEAKDFDGDSIYYSVKAEPKNGEVDVDPALKEIRIEYDQPMDPRGRSIVGGGESFPTLSGELKWLNERTLVLPVTLRPEQA